MANWFDKVFSGLTEMCSAFQKELRALQPLDSPNIKWSRDANGMTAYVVGMDTTSNVQQTDVQEAVATNTRSFIADYPIAEGDLVVFSDYSTMRVVPYTEDVPMRGVGVALSSVSSGEEVSVAVSGIVEIQVPNSALASKLMRAHYIADTYYSSGGWDIAVYGGGYKIVNIADDTHVEIDLDDFLPYYAYVSYGCRAQSASGNYAVQISLAGTVNIAGGSKSFNFDVYLTPPQLALGVSIGVNTWYDADNNSYKTESYVNNSSSNDGEPHTLLYVSATDGIRMVYTDAEILIGTGRFV